MVKNLAEELEDVLNWVENPGLGPHAAERDPRDIPCNCNGSCVPDSP